MLDPARIAQIILGLRHVLKLEPAAFSFFEKSYPGFVRSFIPAILLAPFHMAHQAALFFAAEERPSLPLTIIVESLAYVISWALFPFIMLYVVQSLGRAANYFAYLVPYNWFQFLLGLIVLPLTLLFDARLISVEATAFLNFALIVGVFIYGTFMARFGLGVSALTAFGIVLMDILTSEVSRALIDRIPT